jgi:hypothetical protein
MQLQRGEVLGYDFNRMVVNFTMLNQGKTVRCAISTAAMDDLEGNRGCGCATRLRSEHRVSSSKGQSRLKDRWCCDPTISSSSCLIPTLPPSRPQHLSNRNSAVSGSYASCQNPEGIISLSAV